jgi:hypothetical protein
MQNIDDQKKQKRRREKKTVNWHALEMMLPLFPLTLSRGFSVLLLFMEPVSSPLF